MADPFRPMGRREFREVCDRAIAQAARAGQRAPMSWLYVFAIVGGLVLVAGALWIFWRADRHPLRYSGDKYRLMDGKGGRYPGEQ